MRAAMAGVLVAMTVAGTVGCTGPGGGGDTCAGDVNAPVGITLNANATPPQPFDGAWVRLDSVSLKDDQLTADLVVGTSREDGNAQQITGVAGQKVMVGSKEHTIVFICQVANNGAPGSSSGRVGLG